MDTCSTLISTLKVYHERGRFFHSSVVESLLWTSWIKCAFPMEAFASIMMIVDWKVRADKIPPPQLLHGCIFKLPSQHWLCFLSGWHCTAMKNICSADFFPYFYFPFLCILYKKLNLPILKSIQFQFQEMILVHGWWLGQSLNKYNYWYLDRQAIAMLKYSSFIRRNKYN